MSQIDHTAIMNNALSRIGGGEIQDEDEDTELARQVVAAYYPRLEAILAIYDWSFARKTYKLDQVAEDAANGFDTTDCKFITGWRHAFAMPGTRLSPPLLLMTDPRRPDDPLKDFLVEQNLIYADCTPLYAKFIVRPDPQVWKPDFKLAVQIAVAADLCVPVTHDANLAKDLREQAEGGSEYQGRGGLIGRALANDAAGSRSKAPIWNDPLTSAHLS